MTHQNGDTLPHGWAWTTLGEITQAIEKVDPTQYPDAEFIYLDISSIENSRNIIVEPKVYLGKDAPSRARQWVRANDILFSTVRVYLNNVAQVPDTYDRQVASTGFSVLRASSGTEPKYLFYLCLYKDFVSQLEKLQRGTSYPAIRDSDMREQVIALPPSNEQRRIVDAIETQFTRLDAGIAALKRLQKGLKRYKAAVLKAACEGQLVPQDSTDEPAAELLERILQERRQKWEANQRAKGKDPRKISYEAPAAPDTDDLPELPPGWVWASVDQLAESMSNGKSLPTSENGFPVLRLTALKKGRIDLSEFKLGEWGDDFDESFLVQENDFFVSRGNGSLNLVGRGGTVENVQSSITFPDTMIRVKFSDKCILLHYIGLVWESSLVRKQIETSAHTTAGIYKINQQHIASFIIPLPPYLEQERIALEAESILSIVDELETIVSTNLVRAERLRQSILKEAFAGRLVAQDPHDEPASDLVKRIKRERSKRG